MRSLSWIVIPLLLVTASSYASNRGILITPDKAGEFEYVEDFTTPRVFRDAFLDNVSTDCWQALLCVWFAQGFGKPPTETSKLLSNNAVEGPNSPGITKPYNEYGTSGDIANARLGNARTKDMMA